MLVQLQVRPASAPQLPEALAMLLECHQRIRTFAELGQRLARSAGAPAHERQEVAQRLVAYFGKAFPLHVDDEDFSLTPRLQQRGVRLAALGFVDQMVAQHEAIDELVAELLPAWRRIASGDDRDDGARAEMMTEASDRLAKLLGDHLELEEREIIPLAQRVLRDEDLREIALEMRARREPSSTAHAA